MKLSLLETDLNIKSRNENYDVHFVSADSLVGWELPGDAIIADAYFKDLLGDINKPVIYVNVDENAKSLEQLAPLFSQLRQMGINRSSTILGIGGGVIQDIVTFIASVYMRGVKWCYVPTTFLGMTDSCLGGKSSINVSGIKNLIGTFHPPQQVIVSPFFVRSLGSSEIASGLAEATKICFCHGRSSFQEYLDLVEPILLGDWQDSQLATLLRYVLNIKKWFIEIDEFDRQERRLLNFGHTWGHALESASNYAIPHGQAVAVGMVAAVIASGDDPLNSSLVDNCSRILSKIILDERCLNLNEDKFMAAFRADKKHLGDGYRVILPEQNQANGLGVREIVLPFDRQTDLLVFNAMNTAISRIWS
jgi:3-dehydroquinate synthase